MIQVVLYMVLLVALAKPVGTYIYWACEKKRVDRFEAAFYRWAGVDPQQEMEWLDYAKAVGLFSLLSLLLLYLQMRVQHLLPLNPEGQAPVPGDLAFNTAASFITNTNWQFYGGESTMSYLTQMFGLAVQNFVSAAAGIAILLTLARAMARQEGRTIGNFWVDLTRVTVYVLLPMSMVLALVLVSQGVPQTLGGHAQATLMEAVTVNGTVANATQAIALGPAASQIAIKQLGTNGGGFYNANSAHPLENPTPLSDFLECFSILVISAALCYTFGLIVGDTRQGWALLTAMMLVFVPLTGVCIWAEQQGNPILMSLGVAHGPGNMEGKEVRIGVPASALWTTATTGASNGSVNSMLDSYTPLGGLVPLTMLCLGEVIFGGVGSGLYGMLVFCLVAVFVAGLMVGRTPEYLGKKVEAFEMKMCSLVILIMPAAVLGFAGLSTVLSVGVSQVSNQGPHGFSEILYAAASMGNNNGSAFAGLNANPYYNFLGGWVMLVSRFWLAFPVLALAGALVRKKKVPPSAGTLPTHNALFIGWLIMVVIIVGALCFFPAMALGPIVEHCLVGQGVTF